VNDGTVNSNPDQVAISVKHSNKAPKANAGKNQTVNENTIVTLDGSESYDQNGDNLTFLWSTPEGITLNSNTAVQPTFIAPEVVKKTKYDFYLIVNDGLVDSNRSKVTITVENVNKKPIADAGDDQVVNEGDSITLDGSGSYDPDGDKLIYNWLMLDGTVLISNDNAFVNFIVPEVKTDTTMTIQLITNDGDLNSQPSLVNIFIKNKGNTSISDFDDYNGFVKVFPNPSVKGDEFTIEINTDFQNLKNGYLTVLNLKGQIVLQRKKLDSKMKIRKLSEGAYLLQVYFSNNHRVTKKIIIK
jgi:hypothetical protein